MPGDETARRRRRRYLFWKRLTLTALGLAAAPTADALERDANKLTSTPSAVYIIRLTGNGIQGIG